MRKERRIKNPEHHPEVTMHQEDLVVPAGKGVGEGAGVLPGHQEHQKP